MSKSQQVIKLLEEIDPCSDIIRIIQNIVRLKASFNQTTLVKFMKDNIPEKEILNLIISILTYSGSDQQFAEFFKSKLEEFRLSCNDLNKYKDALNEIVKMFT